MVDYSFWLSLFALQNNHKSILMYILLIYKHIQSVLQWEGYVLEDYLLTKCTDDYFEIIITSISI